MSELHRTPASPALLLLAAGVALLAIAAAWIGSTNPRDPLAALAPVVSERSLRFVDADGGALLVEDAGSGELLASIPAGEDTFIRGMLRAIGRERQVDDVAADTPLTLSSRRDGSVTVIDEGTGIVYDLRAFGQRNLQEFARFLPQASGHVAAGAGEGNLQTRAGQPGD